MASCPGPETHPVKSLAAGSLILDLEGFQLTEPEIEMIQHPLVGGLIFFTRNYESPEQIQALIKQVRAVRPDLLLCVDQEGGRVQRFRVGMTQFPAMRDLTDCLKEKFESNLAEIHSLLKLSGWWLAVEMRSLGLDLSFTPVIDIDYGHNQVIANRAFGRSNKEVIAHAGAFIEGLQSAGMIATAKHFPGHGYVSADSHLELPIDARSKREIFEKDMAVFKALLPKSEAVMTAHVIYESVDEKWPVGFSKIWIQKYLRQQLGYQGVVISDDLCMEGAKAVGDIVRRAELAVQAGCDLLLVCNEPKEAIRILDTFGIQPSQEVASSSSRRLLADSSVSIPQFEGLDQWAPFLQAQQTLQPVFEALTAEKQS